MALGSFDYRLQPGRRLIVCGKTGSGKTTFAVKYLMRSPYHWVIFNPKGTTIYNQLPDLHSIDNKITVAAVQAAIRKHRFINVKFTSTWNWRYQDLLLQAIHEEFTNIGFMIDELGKLHASNGHIGDGLNGLLTRGRELKQTFIGLVQFPRYIDRAVFSEADYLTEFELQLPKDRRVIYEFTGNDTALVQQRGHNFAFFDLASGRATQYRIAA